MEKDDGEMVHQKYAHTQTDGSASVWAIMKIAAMNFTVRSLLADVLQALVTVFSLTLVVTFFLLSCLLSSALSSFFFIHVSTGIDLYLESSSSS